MRRLARISPLCALPLWLSACMSTSSALRPGPLMPGEIRVGTTQSVARSVEDDFLFAQPGANATKTATSYAAELTLHAGVVRDFDVGIRLRPTSPGAKLEALYQLVREKTLGVGISLGLGADGFYSPSQRVACIEAVCVSRTYGGLGVDVPLIFNFHVWRHWNAFVAARYTHLFVWGSQTYASNTNAFDSLVVDTSISQPGVGWAVGVAIEGLHWRIVPQLDGGTVRLPDGSMGVIFTPALDLAAVF